MVILYHDIYLNVYYNHAKYILSNCMSIICTACFDPFSFKVEKDGGDILRMNMLIFCLQFPLNLILKGKTRKARPENKTHHINHSMLQMKLMKVGHT